MTRDAITETLENIARLLELKGENPFKIRAYQNAARALETAPLAPNDLTDPAKLQSIEGIGEAIAQKIATLAATGTLPFYESLRAEFPSTLLDLFTLQGLGAKKIKALHQSLGIASIPQLEEACLSGRVAALPGFGEKTAAAILRAIAHRREGEGVFLYASISPMASAFLDELRQHPAVHLAAIAGSFRRRKETVRDLDFLVTTSNPASVVNMFTSHHAVSEILASGPTKASVRWQCGIQCDLRAVRSHEFPFALAYFTGSKEHNVRLRSLSLTRHWTLNEYRLALTENPPPSAEPPPPIPDEPSLHRALGLDYIPPELRENLGEIEAAASGTLPRLIEIENLRGALHNHTTASDGRSTLEEMAHAAIELGLEYLGIADHSRSSVQARGLDIPRLEKQLDEIARLNASLQGELTILAGTECDILRDGSLDFPDEILARLDYVVASVHSALTLPEAEMTRRIIRAIQNPFVSILAHPTGRLLLSRQPAALDIPAILEAAAATHTVIELNCNPRRLDLDWRWWPRAKALGVRCAINPDAHSTHGLHDLAYGIGIARKGWLTRADVINCLPLPQLLHFFKTQRQLKGTPTL